MVNSKLRTMVPSRSSDRWLAGVAGGLAHRLGVQPIYVRAGFVVFGLVGFAAYVVLLMLSIDSVAEEDVEPYEATGDRKVALLLITLGGLLLVREAGLVPGFTLPVALVLFGAAALWDRSTPAGRSRLTRLVAPSIGGAPTLGRALGGVALLIVGLLVLLSGASVIRQAGWLVLGILVTAAGATLVFGPWLYRLGSELTAERSRRVRADARAEVAAHLHDSVLQTLALIQRSSDDPRRMVTLARSQERELRNWLYKGSAAEADQLEAALSQVADYVEQHHNVPIDVIVVGDAAVDEHVTALLGAAREAMVNAAKHSGSDLVTVYAEVGDGRVDVWITDLGEGFDPDAINGAGVGISGSIADRMRRHGGSATISSGPEGTEVHLSLILSEATR
jgi:signal transduction histidine kinase/phage shock protein PspC (stress-responsive transcriptional regulator)